MASSKFCQRTAVIPPESSRFVFFIILPLGSQCRCPSLPSNTLLPHFSIALLLVLSTIDILPRMHAVCLMQLVPKHFLRWINLALMFEKLEIARGAQFGLSFMFIKLLDDYLWAISAVQLVKHIRLEQFRPSGPTKFPVEFFSFDGQPVAFMDWIEKIIKFESPHSVCWLVGCTGRICLSRPIIVQFPSTQHKNIRCR